MYIFDQVKYLGVWINASLKDDDDIQRQVKSLYCAENKLRGTLDQCSPAVKNTVFRAYCMPMYARQLWSKYTKTSMKRLRAAYNNAYRIMHYIAYPEMLVFAHTRLAILSRPLMPCWKTICIDFVYDARLHPTFLFDRFKYLMPFTNLHFPSIIQRSCMMENKCSSCWWIVLFRSSRLTSIALCSKKICGQSVHTKHTKSKKCC